MGDAGRVAVPSVARRRRSRLLHRHRLLGGARRVAGLPRPLRGMGRHPARRALSTDALRPGGRGLHGAGHGPRLRVRGRGRARARPLPAGEAPDDHLGRLHPAVGRAPVRLGREAGVAVRRHGKRRVASRRIGGVAAAGHAAGRAPDGCARPVRRSPCVAGDAAGRRRNASRRRGPRRMPGRGPPAFARLRGHRPLRAPPLCCCSCSARPRPTSPTSCSGSSRDWRWTPCCWRCWRPSAWT